MRRPADRVCRGQRKAFHNHGNRNRADDRNSDGKGYVGKLTDGAMVGVVLLRFGLTVTT